MKITKDAQKSTASSGVVQKKQHSVSPKNGYSNEKAGLLSKTSGRVRGCCLEALREISKKGDNCLDKYV